MEQNTEPEPALLIVRMEQLNINLVIWDAVQVHNKVNMTAMYVTTYCSFSKAQYSYDG